MQISGGGERPEQVERDGVAGSGEHVDGSVGQEEIDVLHVVEVGASHPLHVLVGKVDLAAVQRLGVLRVGEDLLGQPLLAGEECHDPHLDDQQGRVEPERLQQCVVHVHFQFSS